MNHRPHDSSVVHRWNSPVILPRGLLCRGAGRRVGFGFRASLIQWSPNVREASEAIKSNNPPGSKLGFFSRSPTRYHLRNEQRLPKPNARYFPWHLST